ncbi:MAG: hypothetical protein EBZ77_08155 [Chitinophagia bacterium]|nr:hypothetical protein [Chitinophagia bacterium]
MVPWFAGGVVKVNIEVSAMGFFLSLSAIAGRPGNEVAACLREYACSKGGGLDATVAPGAEERHCIVHEANGNTTVIYPERYFLWDETSAYLSERLGTPVFFFHIHDTDLWMYELFCNGEVVDQFNTNPRYWDEEMPDDEVELWRGNAEIVAAQLPVMPAEQVARYLTGTAGEKAFADDLFPSGEPLQMTDFMRRLGFAYEYTDDGVRCGDWYHLYTAKYKPGANPEEATHVEVETGQPDAIAAEVEALEQEAPEIPVLTAYLTEATTPTLIAGPWPEPAVPEAEPTFELPVTAPATTNYEPAPPPPAKKPWWKFW